MTQYAFTDWQSGTKPPKGWDCADAVRDGWTKKDIDDFMRASVQPWTPPVVAKTETSEKSTERPKESQREPNEQFEPSASATTAHKQTSALEEAPDPDKDFQTVVPAPRAVGASAIDRFSAIRNFEWGSEVEIATEFTNRIMIACGGDVVKADGKFWAFGPTAWQEIPDQKLRLAVHKFDGVGVGDKGAPLKIGKRTIDGVLSEAGTILSEPDFFNDPTVAMNALNGVIVIGPDGNVTVRAHDPEDKFRFTIPAEFNAKADRSPPTQSMLHKLVHGAFKGDPDEEDKINLVGEILGAAALGLATRMPQPKAFVFLGETASNGKSTIASLLSCLLPAGSVSAIPPAAFSDERRIVNLAGKAANVADELSAAAIAGETFKAAITGNPIEGRDLYRSAVTFIPRALHCFTTNTLPRFNGGLDRGLQRRLVVLTFNRPIPEKEIIPDISDHIRNSELDLLLGFAIAGAQRLMKNRAYTIPQSSKEALQGWLLLDPVNEWFEAHIAPCKDEPYDGWMRTGELFNDFKKWALEQGHSERFLPPVNTFSQRLKAMPNVIVKRTAKGSVAVGIKLSGGLSDERAKDLAQVDW
ncbi:hypothetical protein HB779_17235 [Phyllobacterium sp. 628]|uniref:DNA primase family protein n=1 Tax=Phyllobacterium sp. 628 TaxID=2718938 RepID=UPI0016626086|nr:DUF5906 domain-containing protein [Phyllobacterium sp. 628]QND53435.1 hypothetical protein HB779_17235 [Phyllobacterium sp. 628]